MQASSTSPQQQSMRFRNGFAKLARAVVAAITPREYQNLCPKTKALIAAQAYYYGCW